MDQRLTRSGAVYNPYSLPSPAEHVARHAGDAAFQPLRDNFREAVGPIADAIPQPYRDGAAAAHHAVQVVGEGARGLFRGVSDWLAGDDDQGFVEDLDQVADPGHHNPEPEPGPSRPDTSMESAGSTAAPPVAAQAQPGVQANGAPPAVQTQNASGLNAVAIYPHISTHDFVEVRASRRIRIRIFNKPLHNCAVLGNIKLGEAPQVPGYKLDLGMFEIPHNHVSMYMLPNDFAHLNLAGFTGWKVEAASWKLQNMQVIAWNENTGTGTQRPYNNQTQPRLLIFTNPACEPPIRNRVWSNGVNNNGADIVNAWAISGDQGINQITGGTDDRHLVPHGPIDPPNVVWFWPKQAHLDIPNEEAANPFYANIYNWCEVVNPAELPALGAEPPIIKCARRINARLNHSMIITNADLAIGTRQQLAPTMAASTGYIGGVGHYPRGQPSNYIDTHNNVLTDILHSPVGGDAKNAYYSYRDDQVQYLPHMPRSTGGPFYFRPQPMFDPDGNLALTSMTFDMETNMTITLIRERCANRNSMQAGQINESVHNAQGLRNQSWPLEEQYQPNNLITFTNA